MEESRGDMMIGRPSGWTIVRGDIFKVNSAIKVINKDVVCCIHFVGGSPHTFKLRHYNGLEAVRKPYGRSLLIGDLLNSTIQHMFPPCLPLCLRRGVVANSLTRLSVARMMGCGQEASVLR